MTYEEILCDANTLYKAYTASIKGSKWKETTQKFALNYLRYIFELQDDLRNQTLQNGKKAEFTLHERGRVRPITSIKIKDRIVRHALCDDVLLPEVRKRIIYDNCASIKGRGIAQQRKRFDIHLHKYYQEYGNDGWILFGDFSKFYDNILHETAKRELSRLVDDDAFITWLLNLIFDEFKVDVSHWSDEAYENRNALLFNQLEHRKTPRELLTGERWMDKSVSIGDQLSQVIGIYYPYRIDNYVKYVRGQKYYGRYSDDWYIMNPNKEALTDMLAEIQKIAAEYGIHINDKKTKIVKIGGAFKFLQVKYTLGPDGKIRKLAASSRITAMRTKLKKLAVKVANGEREYACAEDMFRSWMGSFYKLMTRQQRTVMIALYESLYHKKITIQNQKMTIEEG
jgi:RNA-directed DNA polymerase